MQAGRQIFVAPANFFRPLVGMTRGAARGLSRAAAVSASSAWSRRGPTDGPHLPASAASTVEPIASVGLEPRHAHAGWHVEPLQDFSRSRIDSSQVALVTFPGAVPELSVDPGDAGDEAIGLDGAQNRAGLGIDLMDLPLSILPHP